MFVRLYRALLWLYPPGFRRRYWRQMSDDFEEMRAQGTPVRFAFLDLLRTVPREWASARPEANVGANASVLDRGYDVLVGFGRGLRSLARRPRYTVVVVASLGIGVGSATAVFSWTEGLVLRPLPAVRSLSELLSIDLRDVTRPAEDPVAAFADYRDLRDGSEGVVDLAAFGFGQFTVGPTPGADVRGTERLWGAWVTPEYFTVLGVDPLVGRLLRPSDAGSATSERSAFISEALWARMFGRDPVVIGRTVHVANRELQILGVLPGGFSGTTVGLRLDIWLSTDAVPFVQGTPELLSDRSRRWLRVFGRPAPGVEREAVERRVGTVWAGLEADGVGDEAIDAEVVSFDIGIAARLEPLLGILLGLTAFMLLAVCSNVANLTLLRGATHDHEVAVRRALGADRSRVAGAVLTESLLLGALGVSAGLLLARLGAGLLPALLPPTPLPLNLEARIDLRVFAFCAVLGFLAAMVSGAAPALRAMRSEPVHVLRARGQRARGSAIQHGALIVVQLALSLGTLVAAGFFLDRLGQLGELDRGFADAEGVMLFSAELPPEEAARAGESGAIGRLVEAAAAAAGVRSAAVASFVPLGFVGYSELDVEVPGAETADVTEPARYLVNRVGAGYFDVVGTPLVAGRPLDGGDVPGSTGVVVVNEAFVERHWPGLDPIGRGVRLGGVEALVVGVAANGKYRFDEFDQPTPPFLFVALAQWPSTALTLHLRVDPAVPLDVAAVRGAFDETFPLARLSEPVSLEEYTSLPLVPVRLGVSVLGGLGAIAMMLAALGLYAIMGFRVAQRTREVGVRLAVGAGRAHVMRMFVREGFVTAALGIGAGVPLVVGIHRAFAALIPGFDPSWVAVYTVASAALLMTALIAVTLAALRAMSIAPTEALRAE